MKRSLTFLRTITALVVGLFAVTALATGDALGMEAVSTGHSLAPTVDWLTGFTAHLDMPGGAGVLASGAAAAAVPDGGEDGDEQVTLTKDGIRDLLDEIQGRSEPSEEDVETAARQIATDEGGDQQTRNAPQLNTEGSLEVEGGEPRKAPWEQRTVRYFNALVTSKDNQEQGIREIQGLRRDLKEMPDRQWQDEEDQARQVVKDADLRREQQNRILSMLELGRITRGSERLMTTSTTDTPKAGYLLPKPFLAELFVIIEDYGVARDLFRAIPMISKEVDLKNITSKVAAYWTNEGANFTASDLGFSEESLSVNKLAGITSWTNELAEDQAIAFLPVVQQLFAESMAEKEDRAGLLGDGASAFGGFTGVLNLPSAQAVTFATGSTTAAALSESHLRSVKTSLSESRRNGAVWLMHQTVLEEIRQLENSSGARIMQEMIVDGGPSRLLGYPVVTSEVMPAYSNVAAGEAFIAFGNMRNMLMGQRRGVTADVSREAVLQDGTGAISYNAFQADGALLRISERLGFQSPSAVQPNIVVVKTAAS